MGTSQALCVRLAAVAVLVASCASTSNGAADTAGRVAVTGTVLTAPTCPVERPGHPCPPRPVPGAVITVSAHAEQVLRATADSTGHFNLELAPGSYRVAAQFPSGLRNTASKDVTVASTPVRITLTIDSGIR